MFEGFRTTGAPLDVTALDSADAAFAAAVDAVAATQREIDALQARRARQVAAVIEAAERVEVVSGTPTARTAEFVHRSTRAELALGLRISEPAAERLMAESLRLVRVLPAALGAVEAGQVCWRAAACLAEAVLPLIQERDAGGPDRVAEFEAAALDAAMRIAPSRLRSRLRLLCERLRSDSAIERHAEALRDRRVILEDAEDGMAWLHAFLPAVEAHAVFHRLRDLARATQDLDAEECVPDERTLAQRGADLLVDFLVGDEVRVAGRAGAGRAFSRFAGIRPTVVVTVPVQTLLDRDDAADGVPALLDGIVPIDPATARRLTAAAPSLYRLLTDPHTGAALDLSRTRYHPSPALRLWLRLRDGTCRFPGCGRPAKGCDLDHSVDWQYGGATAAANLAHLCRGHHTLKHQTRWQPRQHPDGTIAWRSPSGRTHMTHPAPPPSG